MRSRGLVGLVALTMAAVATLAIFLYIQGVRSEVETGGGTVKVIVAQHDIPAGSSLNELIEQGAFAQEAIPRTNLVEGAVTAIDELQDKKTSSPILEGEQVSTARLQGSGTLPGGTLGIPKGHQAMSLALDGPRVVAGKINPGDMVAIWGTFDGQNGSNASATISLVPEAKVLATSGTASTGEQTLITLALEPNDAARVIYGQEKGSVWISLIPPGERGTRVPAVGLVKVLR